MQPGLSHTSVREAGQQAGRGLGPCFTLVSPLVSRLAGTDL